MIQSVAGLLSLILSLVVVAVAVFVMRRARDPDAGGYAAVYRVRRYYAAGLIGALALILLVTLGKTPYRRSLAETPARVVDVTGLMWMWEFRIGGERVELPLVVPAHELVEFAVTARDVNHGFGIYDPQGHLVAQTQAMPGYVNRLRVRFEEPGTYRILCLEFCGVGHAIMMADISVQ